MNWYLKALKQYADFSTRARRKEYWMYVLFNFLSMITALILSVVLGMYVARFLGWIFNFIYLAIVLGTLVPSLAVAVRRLHDTNRSGYWIFIGLVPIIGGIWLLVLLCTEGTSGENDYGPDPKQENSYNTEALDGTLV